MTQEIKNVDSLFQFHRLNEAGIDKALGIAKAFDDLHFYLLNMCGSGRELSIVKTKLEEACFFAKKSMAQEPENQVKT